MNRRCRIAVVSETHTTQFQGTIIGSRGSIFLVLTLAAGFGSQSKITVISDYGYTERVVIVLLDRLENIAILQVSVLGTESGVGRVSISRDSAYGNEVVGALYGEYPSNEVKATVIHSSYYFGDNDSKAEYIIAKAENTSEIMGSAGLGIFLNGKQLTGIFEAYCQKRPDLLCIRKLSPSVIYRLERYLGEYSGADH